MKRQTITAICLAAACLTVASKSLAQGASGALTIAQNDTFAISKYHAAFEELEKIQAVPNIWRTDYSQAYVVKVSNQREFDRIQGLITSALNVHDKVLVRISSGTYTFRENHIDLTNADYSGKKLYIEGAGDVRIIGATAIYRASDKRSEQGLSCFSLPSDTAFSHTTSYTDSHEMLPVASTDDVSGGRFLQLDTLMEMMDSVKGIVRARLPRELSSLEIDEDGCKDIYIQIPMWFMGRTEKVVKITGGYVYFIYTFTRKGYGTKYFFDNDYGFNLEFYKEPRYGRFRLLNLDLAGRGISISRGRISIPHSHPLVYECRNATFIKTKGTKLQELDIAGITFIGNGGNADQALMLFDSSEVAGRIAVHDNRFIGMKTMVILANTDNVSVYDNYFSHTYVNDVVGTNLAARACVYHNTFEACNEGIEQHFCVMLSGPDYYIGRNVMHNFRYGAIGAGVHFAVKTLRPINGIIEFNRMYCDDDYLAGTNNHGLMDSGAIYMWTINDLSIVRYNWIYNYGGAGANRGIFLDDGVKGCKVYGNVISNIVNGLCIDLRNVPTSGRFVKDYNENNLVMYNIMDGGYRYHGKKGTDSNILGRNIVVYKTVKPQRQIFDFSDPESDCFVHGMIDGSTVKIDCDYFLRRSWLPFNNEISDAVFGGYMLKRYMEEQQEKADGDFKI